MVITGGRRAIRYWISLYSKYIRMKFYSRVDTRPRLFTTENTNYLWWDLVSLSPTQVKLRAEAACIITSFAKHLWLTYLSAYVNIENTHTCNYVLTHMFLITGTWCIDSCYLNYKHTRRRRSIHDDTFSITRYINAWSFQWYT